MDDVVFILCLFICFMLASLNKSVDLWIFSFHNFIKIFITSFGSDLTHSRSQVCLLHACPGALTLNVGQVAGLLCTFGSSPTHLLSCGHPRHFALIARHSLNECSLFVCLFASLPELLVIYFPFLAGRNSGSQCLNSLSWQQGSTLSCWDVLMWRHTRPVSLHCSYRPNDSTSLSSLDQYTGSHKI